MWKKTKENVTFAPVFHDPSIKACKQLISMQIRALLNLDKKYCKLFLRAKQLPVKRLIDNRCHALEAVPERRAKHKLTAIVFLQKIKSECKYLPLTLSTLLSCRSICFRIQFLENFYLTNTKCSANARASNNSCPFKI